MGNRRNQRRRVRQQQSEAAAGGDLGRDEEDHETNDDAQVLRENARREYRRLWQERKRARNAEALQHETHQFQ